MTGRTGRNIWIICLVSSVTLTSSFSAPGRRPRNPSIRPPFCKETNLHFSVSEVSSSIILAETESWRQYVPLAVSGLVILDILLGSPAANSVMGLMRAQENDDAEDEASQSGKRRTVVNTAERVDSMAVAQAAIDKANATLELKRFLEDQKTDWDKMEDIRKKMDRQMQELDEKIKEQREQS
ncbi:hypothetical protein FisN_7Lh161 [Fistulifera solaris]|uniref:Uncharacterized protein n=1 Tax=Fistulifera solaris TaxID=1519565 RepID=A0A1Z5JCT0_FISSO|nr:hypothetical protein FisN_7Lh161 [Fistulifera solaris]|eukprot:GAX11779.1 hypothetical protein FisN_7Lh161 [Fistulifera solaris]